MFGNTFRGSALAVAGLAQWIANFLVSTTFPPLASSVGLGGAYGLYCFFALLSVPFVLRLIRETKGIGRHATRAPALPTPPARPREAR